MVSLFIIGDKLGMPSCRRRAFPFVIMTTDRRAHQRQPRGGRRRQHLLRRIAATLASIYLTYAVIRAAPLQTLFLVYPELLLIILGLLVAVGRYTG